MMRAKRLNVLTQEKLVVIIRVSDPEDIMPIVDYLHEAGVKAVEVTSNTPRYDEYLNKVKESYPSLLVGAGTITSAALAEQAINAGAEFLVTPNTCPDVVRYAHQHDVPVMMGALTPTDIVTALNANADIIKLFPAEPLGTAYLAGLAKGPFLNTTIFPVGGINEKNTKAYIDAGAKGVGVGGSLAAPIKSAAQRAELIGKVKQVLKQLEE